MVYVLNAPVKSDTKTSSDYYNSASQKHIYEITYDLINESWDKGEEKARSRGLLQFFIVVKVEERNNIAYVHSRCLMEFPEDKEYKKFGVSLFQCNVDTKEKKLIVAYLPEKEANSLFMSGKAETLEIMEKMRRRVKFMPCKESVEYTDTFRLLKMYADTYPLIFECEDE